MPNQTEVTGDMIYIDWLAEQEFAIHQAQTLQANGKRLAKFALSFVCVAVIVLVLAAVAFLGGAR